MSAEVPVNRETVANILQDAVLYSSLVAVGGSWATFIRESALLLIPGGGIVGEIVAVVLTTCLGIVIAVLASLSLRISTTNDTNIIAPSFSNIEPHITVLTRDSTTARAMRPKGFNASLHVAKSTHSVLHDVRPPDERRTKSRHIHATRYYSR